MEAEKCVQTGFAGAALKRGWANDPLAIRTLLALIFCATLLVTCSRAEDWPQLGCNPQRWNYSPHTVEPPYRLKWFVNFRDMGFGCRVYPGIQVVAGGGNVYIGTKNGCLFALDAQSGAVAWKRVLDGPVMGEAGYAAGKVYIGTMGGVVYAADCKTGKQLWCFENPRRYGFSVGVLLAEGRVIIPDRGGMLYAIEQETGKKVWNYDAGTSILQAAAYNDGKVYFASEDGRVHAIKARTGESLWRTVPLWAHSFYGTWPVVFDGKVIVRYHTTHKVARTGPVTCETNDWRKSVVVLDEATGKEILAIPHITTGMGGPTKPPPITGDGKLVMPWTFKGQGKTRGLVLQDLSAPDQVDRLLDHDKLDEPIEYPFRGGPVIPGFGSHQENFSNSVIGDLVVKVHYHGFAWGDPASQMGAYHLKERRWYSAGGPRSAFPEPVGGDREHNTQGGTSNPVIGAYGHLYHQHWDTVCCWESAGAGEGRPRRQKGQR